MKAIPNIFFVLTAAIAAPTSFYADCPHGAVHIVLRDGETIDDCTLDEPLLYEEPRPWYLHENFDYYDAYNDPTYEVDAEAAWPSQREEYSDYLFR